jgi:hypothetical protein
MLAVGLECIIQYPLIAISKAIGCLVNRLKLIGISGGGVPAMVLDGFTVVTCCCQLSATPEDFTSGSIGSWTVCVAVFAGLRL